MANHKSLIKMESFSKLILIFGLFLIYACESEQNKDSKSEIATEDSTKVILSNTQQDDTLLHLNNEQTKPVFNIDACKSPAGLSIVLRGPSDIEGQYYFFDDNRIVNRFYQEFALVGTWSIEDNLITINYDTKYYREGVGTPIPIEGGIPGNYIPQYKQNEYLTEPYNETESYYWDEIKSEIKDETGFYEIIAHDLNSNTFADIINLEID